MGTGVAQGENRAVEAAQRAICSPLLEEGSIEGAEGVLVNITGGPDLGIHEATDAMSIIQKAASDDAHIIFGTVVKEEQRDDIVVTVIATGFDNQHKAEEIIRPPFRVKREQPLEQPAYLRRKKVSNGMDFYSPDEEYDGEDLDVPTFLRKQAD
jgi:cell division protein FtsZ